MTDTDEPMAATARRPAGAGGSELAGRYQRDGYVVLADVMRPHVRPDGQGGCAR